MATKIVVPDAGQTTDELLLARWHVSEGDEVEAGDFLCDIETDKAVQELESHSGGCVLKLLVDEGDTITTGQTLLWLGEEGEEVEEDEGDGLHGRAAHATGGGEGGVGEAEVRTADGVGAEAPPTGRRATPAARSVARERGIELEGIVGSGPEGCIVKRDVGGTAIPMTPMRKAIAARLQQSVREAPHFYVAIDVDMTQALAVREAAEAKVTVNDLIVKASADTLAEHPRMNCRLEGDAIRLLEDVNVGIAVGVEDGLVVPVLARVSELSLAEVAEQSRRLVSNARDGRLPAGVQAGFTVSNLGMFGVKSFSAIINPPEAAILAVGAVGDKLVLAESGVVAQPTTTLTLSSDHRIIDGQLAARFLAALKERLERPASPARRDQQP